MNAHVHEHEHVHVRKHQFYPLDSTKSLLHEADELVSAAGTSRWIKEHNLESSWRVEMVNTKAVKVSLKEHLITDERSLGQREWSRLNAAIEDFLARN